MRKKHQTMELLILPSLSGLIKVHIYGFREQREWGQVFAELNGTVVSAKGYHRKKTIIRTLAKLNESLLNPDH
ncbi:hypothetical protein SM124_02415 [Bacillus sp. 31A1R]|uniref:Uncharacterized protein n=1 Tax=Robertmurraya mangrovi TaxID=3098077 RepID=A0ABU5ITW9_9BACI|nr:hypothetical protein [Bacillus sp. 31A1R]MDZ5470595.1 hypothetical protein [Bacillus sp. 31A1R]